MWHWTRVFMVFIAFTDDVRHAALQFGAPAIAWHHDVTSGQIEAWTHRKPVALFFGGSGDEATRVMRSETFADPEVRWLLRNDFVAVDLEERSPETKGLKERFRIRRVPTLLVLEADMRTELRRFDDVVTPQRLATGLRLVPRRGESS
jgi:hypothetical protein